MKPKKQRDNTITKGSETVAVFNGMANEYDGWYLTPQGKFVDEVESALAFSLFGPQPGQLILDAGCGTGNFSLKLAERGCRVVGIDLSEGMLAAAVAKANRQGYPIDFQVMDVYNLKFADNQFDAVFSMAMFEFIKEPGLAYQELYRVLRPGGLLFIGTIHKDSSWGRLYESEEYRQNSVFKHAILKTGPEMDQLDPDHLIGAGECLFVPPTADPAEYTWEKERSYAATESGGFIGRLWRKPGQL